MNDEKQQAAMEQPTSQRDGNSVRVGCACGSIAGDNIFLLLIDCLLLSRRWLACCLSIYIPFIPFAGATSRR